LTSPRAALLFGEPFFWLLGMRWKKRMINLMKVKRVLVVRLDEIGDVVMTSSFLRELRRNLPDAWITLVVKPAVYTLVELCPYVNEVLTYDHKTSGDFAEQRRHGRALNLALKHMWRRRFDLAILPRWDADDYHGTFLTYFSGAPRRVGYSASVSEFKRELNSGLDCLLSHTLEDSDTKHEIEHNLDVIRFLGGTIQEDQLELWLGENDERFAEQKLKSHGVKPGELLIGFGLGAGSERRMWPIDNFVGIGRWLREEYNGRIIAVGGKGEESLGQEIQQQLGDMVINTVGGANLRQTAALMKCCHLYVGNDAGPMHLAAGAGVPVVEISCHPLHGSVMHVNSPKRFGPWGVPHLVLQPEKALSPCSDRCKATQAHCIDNVSIAQVKKAVEKLIKQKDFTFSAKGKCNE
jgi:heptosyltransferase-2